LKFVRAKTADTSSEVIEIIVPILAPVQKILSIYGSEPKRGERVFPHILQGSKNPDRIKKRVKDWNSNLGDRLKKACAVVGLTKPVSMTYARHSFATNLTRKNVPERYISQAMGHANKNITGGYIGLFSPEDRRRYNVLLLDPVNKA
jgi:integrase